jgi:hypothetical protein
MALSANKTRDYPIEDGPNELPVKGSTHVYEGAALGDDGSGYMRGLTAGDPFRGFALREADNSDGSDGDINVRIRKSGYVQVAISGVGISDAGKDVYASDDDTFTLTQGSNTRIGHVHRVPSSGVAVVAYSEADGVEAELTDNSGGSADDTIAAVSGSGDDATINGNFADMAAKLNYLLRRLGS